MNIKARIFDVTNGNTLLVLYGTTSWLNMIRFCELTAKVHNHKHLYVTYTTDHLYGDFHVVNYFTDFNTLQTAAFNNVPNDLSSLT